MKYDNLSLLGYGNDIQYSSESYLLHTRALDQQMSKAYAEGIFGAVSSGVKAVGRGIRDGAQMGKAGIKRLWEIIKKVLNGFMQMLQQMWIDIGNNQGKMKDLIPTLQGLITQLKKDDALESMKQKITVDSYTVRTFNLAGWNLSIGNISQTNALDDIFKRVLQRKNNTSINDNQQQITDSIGTVAFFVRLMALRNDGVSPEEAFVNIKNIDGLYQALNVLFKEAYNIYTNNGDYANFLGWGNQTKLWGIDVLNNKDGYIYQAFRPDDYGKYVAQAFSPAGAFVTLNKESFNQSKNRIDNMKKKLTPVKEEDIPSANCQKEFLNACNYLIILFETLVTFNVIDSLKERAKKLNKLLQKVNELEKVTGEDVASSNIAQNDLNKRNFKYGELNDDGTINSQPNGQQQPGQTPPEEGGSESFGLENDLLDLNDALSAFSEAIFGASNPNGLNNSSYLDTLGTAQNVQMNGSDDARKDFQAQAVHTTPNFSSAFKSHTLDIKKNQLTGEGIVMGIKYLHKYLISAGNLCFQEGRFYNIMTKIMCDTANDFIKIVKDWLAAANESEMARRSDTIKYTDGDAALNNAYDGKYNSNSDMADADRKMAQYKKTNKDGD